MTFAEATLLIVDDEPILRLTFSVLLKKTGAKVFTAEHGEEAMEILSREPIDAMLTDKQMPVMDGITLLQTLYQRNMVVPSVLFVNGVTHEDPDELARLGVINIVTKPLYPNDLIRIFEKLLKPLVPRS
jgi:two-component system chemotaxis response regulator CheY